MLQIETYGNNKTNDWLVRQFEVYRFTGTSTADKFVPRPDLCIVFHFNDCAFIEEETSLKLEPFFVAPIIPKAITLKFDGEMDTLAVSCKASVLSRIFNLDLSPVSKRSINLPADIFFPLWKTMADLPTTAGRIACFSEFVNTIRPQPYRPDAIDTLYDKIIEKSISSPIKEIMAECSASRSTLFRKFIRRTGVSPKTLARVVRLDYLWSQIRDESAIDYRELVFGGNYFDQSHFINDFKYIIGETPHHFFSRNLDIVKKFSGKSPVRSSN